MSVLLTHTTGFSKQTQELGSNGQHVAVSAGGQIRDHSTH